MPRKTMMKKSTMMKKIITTIYFIYVIFMTSFGEVYSEEWNCSSDASSKNTGTFTRSTDCTISGTLSATHVGSHVVVINTLEIVGTNTDMNNLITITAATHERHFKLISPNNAKLGYSGIKCNAGHKLVNGNATSDENCVQCSPGQFQRWNQFTGRKCQVQQDIKCNAGHKLVQNAISDAYCLECDEGQFQSANQFIGTSCTNWKQCNKNESISFNGNLISDRTCILKPTKPANVITTAAPSVTTTNAAITSSKRKKNELSNSTVNTMSIISIVIMFMIVIYNL